LVGTGYGFNMYYASSGHDYYPLPGLGKPGAVKNDLQWPERGEPYGLGQTTPTMTSTLVYCLKHDPSVPDTLVAYRRGKLKDINMATKEKKAKVATEATAFSTTKIPAGAHSIVVAGSQILVAGTTEVVVLDKTGQQELSRFPVEGKISPNGLSVARGKAYVVTEDHVVCLGK
jgi:hypothetical protein